MSGNLSGNRRQEVRERERGSISAKFSFGGANLHDNVLLKQFI